MQYTSKLNLQMPEATDTVSPAPFNSNSTTLDDALLSTAQTLTVAEQQQVQSNLNVPSTTNVSTEIAGKALRYDSAQSLNSTQTAQARNNAGLSVATLLNTTSVTTTETSFNVAWDDYELLIFSPGISGNATETAIMPSSFISNTTSTVRLILPAFVASNGAHAFSIEIRQNGSGKLYIRLSASTTYTPRLRIYGFIKL